MRLLAAASYDPAVAVSKSLGSAAAMAALDANLRVTFTAPDTGNVLVRLRATLRGNGTGAVCFGVLDGATVRGRLAPIAYRNLTGSTAGRLDGDSTFVVTGLTPGTSYTWDFAFSVENGVASSNLSYGGPDNTVAGDAHGAASISIWEARGLLASILYDPAVAVVGLSTNAAAVFTAHDTTNLRNTFTAPPSGIVAVRQQFVVSGATTSGEVLVGVLDGATIRGRILAAQSLVNVAGIGATDHSVVRGWSVITGLIGGTTYNFDAAMSVETIYTSGNVKYGGPNDATNDNAWGGFAYEVWDPQEVGLLEMGVT